MIRHSVGSRLVRGDGGERDIHPVCRLEHALLGVAAALTLLYAVGGLPAAAQNRDGVRTNQAVLHIQATIVPAVVDPENHDDNQHDLVINYNLQQRDSRLYVTEESRYVSIERERASGEEVILLRTTTVVPK